MFRTLERPSIYYKLTLSEIVSMVGGSLPIVIVISTFVGGVTTLNIGYQFDTQLVPRSFIGSIVSVSSLLELAPTVVTFILAGRIGSKIASELGTMRVKEQIDAIEVMGINPNGYLILPRILGGLISIPILVTASAFLLHLGGLIVGVISGVVNAVEFGEGLQMYFDPHQVTVMYVKAFMFGYLITSVSAYQGFYTRGGALEVGVSSTRAVVYSCLTMVIADYFIAEILL